MPAGETVVEVPLQDLEPRPRNDGRQSQWLRSLVMEKPLVKARGAGGL
jgi:hypothetical protein